jgi:hypothetical protein
MAMIDVYGALADKHELAVDLATALRMLEQVQDIAMSRGTPRRWCMTSALAVWPASTATATVSAFGS